MIKLVTLLILIFYSVFAFSKGNVLENGSSNNRSDLVNKISNLIQENYVFPDIAIEIEKVLKNNASKKYVGITNLSDLAKQLTIDIQAISHDKHLQVIYSEIPLKRQDKMPSISQELKSLPFSKSFENFGFYEVKRLNGNVGYLAFDFFAPPELAAETAAASMAFIGNSDALILDLRNNHGGDPAMVAFIATYFFGYDPVHLNDFYWRNGNRIQQSWTLPYVPGKRYLNKRIYILTSHNTFSGGEEFAYDLKNLKRAIIVGENTAGGANPSYLYVINDHFEIWIPGGKAINPITKTNWEGVGVTPDVKTSQNEALKIAYKMALQTISKMQQ